MFNLFKNKKKDAINKLQFQGKKSHRVLDPQWKNGMRLYTHNLWKPEWKEIWAMMLGSRVCISVVTHTEHKPGNCASTITPRITTFTNPGDPELIAFLKLEQDRAAIVSLPTKEQFEAAKAINQEIKEVVKKHSA